MQKIHSNHFPHLYYVIQDKFQVEKLLHTTSIIQCSLVFSCRWYNNYSTISRCYYGNAQVEKSLESPSLTYFFHAHTRTHTHTHKKKKNYYLGNLESLDNLDILKKFGIRLKSRQIGLHFRLSLFIFYNVHGLGDCVNRTGPGYLQIRFGTFGYCDFGFGPLFLFINFGIRIKFTC